MDTTIRGRHATVPIGGFPTFLAYAYLLRVQLIIAAVVFALPFAALWHASPLRALLENLFVLDWRGTAISSMAALILAWSLVLTGRIVLLNGFERFGAHQWLTQNTLKPRTLWVAVVLVIPMVAAQFLSWKELKPLQASWLGQAAAVLLGLAAAYVIAYVGLLGAVLLSPAGTQPAAKTFPAPGLFGTLLSAADDRALIPQAVLKMMRTVLLRMPQDVTAGYIDNRREFHERIAEYDCNPQGAHRDYLPVSQQTTVDNREYGLPWSGHWLAFAFAVATFVVYYAIDFYRVAHLGEDTSIPALAFVLLLLLNANWILAFVAFFFDRFRIPLLAPLAVIAAFGTHAPGSDHYFSVNAGQHVSRITPGDVLLARAAASGAPSPVIIVATAGGGIQAAAWTVRVLTGLEEQSRQWKGSRSFARSVALVSSVSGGAAGAMFFVNHYSEAARGFDLLDADDDSRLIATAEMSSLEDIGWALVYRDVPRILVPYGASHESRLLDRGRMLELGWQRRARLFSSLGNWRAGVREGWRPAVAFNSTIAETGEPLIFGTTDLPQAGGGNRDFPALRSFTDVYPDVDIPVTTAVRLAAAFPYVSPAARADLAEPEYHIVDGGYYDNYGVAAAIAWIDKGIEEFKIARGSLDALPPILILTIRSFPDDSAAVPTNRGWFYQAVAPIEGLFQVRTTTQLARDKNELLLLRDRWGGDRNGMPRIRFASLQFLGEGAPLSWRMNAAQQTAIGRMWQDLVSPPPGRESDAEDLRQVRCVLTADTTKRCRDLASQKEPW